MMQSLGRRMKEKVEAKVDKKLHGVKWKGSVQLETKKAFLQLVPDLWSGMNDTFFDLIGYTVQFELVGIDRATGNANRSGKSHMKVKPKLSGGFRYTVGFRVTKDFGEPAALLVENHHSNEFLLQHIKLKCGDAVSEVPCNSWIYTFGKYNKCPRIFFINKAYLPRKTPIGLQPWRDEALRQLRGESGNPGGIRSERKEHDRVYDYDVYNDLGDPDYTAEDVRRETLGGSSEWPYPRRCRTGRTPTRDGRAEAPTKASIYVPRDEQFDNTKRTGFLFDGVKSFIPHILPRIRERMVQQGSISAHVSSAKFSSFGQIFRLYSTRSRKEGSGSGSGSSTFRVLELAESVQVISNTVRQLLENPLQFFLKFSAPQIIGARENIQSSKEWKADEEFGRQTLAGVNPQVIERVKELPKDSHLASQLHGRKLDDELTVEQAIAQNRLYIVDYYDAFLPYVEKVNRLIADSKIYASRTVLFLKKNGTLEPIAIELTLSENDGGSRVFFPPGANEEGWLWHLAKAHVTINDTGYHELISHWLRTHACMEPFVIATHRTLSVLHPVNVLLAPHFKDTMQINGLARQILVNAHKKGNLLSGIIEMGFCTDRYSMEFSSRVYKQNWRFDEEALPRDLIRRGMAVRDPDAKYNLRLYVEDYPYAVDGLEIWFAIKSWVNDYLSIYYENDMAVEDDSELQSWWLEIKEKGHGDKKNEKWWVKMRTKEELEEVIVTIIWIASAQHAAVNFGQYAYGGFMPNRPTRAGKLIPDEGTEEYNDLLTDPTEKVYLESLSNQQQATIVMATLEILSNHSSNEEYLGQRKTPHWTSNENVLQAFNKFANCIQNIETNIKNRNEDPKLKNRNGLVNVPYTLLIPTSLPGITGRGIPNSISI